MKFLCLECDQPMDFAERQLPGDGTLAAVFTCPGCGREMAMLTNPMETRLVSSLGVKIGGRDVPAQPMELVRGSLEGGREDAFEEPPHPPSEDVPVAPPPQADDSAHVDASGPLSWSPEASERLGQVPRFVRGMVKRIYGEWAREQGVTEMTPELMDRARSELGMEGM